VLVCVACHCCKGPRRIVLFVIVVRYMSNWSLLQGDETISCVRGCKGQRRPSVCPRGTARLLLDGFSWNLIFEYFSKICWENSSLIKIGEEWRVLHIKTNIHFWSYLAQFYNKNKVYIYIYIYSGGRDSSVGIVTGYGLDGSAIESRWGAGFFAHVHTGPRAHPASCIMGTGSFPRVKRPGRGADHPPPSSVPRSGKSRAIPLPPPPSGPSGLLRGTFTFYICIQSSTTIFLLY
jgi:hypothetical protein